MWDTNKYHNMYIAMYNCTININITSFVWKVVFKKPKQQTKQIGRQSVSDSYIETQYGIRFRYLHFMTLVLIRINTNKYNFEHSMFG